jgi:type IV secretion system protein VirB9
VSRANHRTGNRGICFGALLATCVAPIAAAAADTAVRESETRLRTITYSSAEVLSLTGFVGYHIHFEFAPDERFLTLAAGDTAGLDVGAEGNHLLLKPKRASAGTNLTILTNRRSYFIDFRALARVPLPGELVYSVTFRYPPTDLPPGAASVVNNGEPALTSMPAATNRNYWYCGADALRPSSVDDDGIQTRLTFPPHTGLPAIYASAPDGAESLVNSHVENDTIVVHRLSERFVLRRGALVGCIVNRSFDANARRARGGTVRTDVDRVTREARP